MKINIGCGKQTWAGFYCVDACQHPKATRPLDLVHAYQFDGPKLINPLPIDSGSATEVHAYHFIEHVYRWEAPAVIQDFYRLLKEGGQLILELPDLKLSARNVLNGTSDQLSMWGLYGDPSWKDPFMCHRWGYSPKSIKQLLNEQGFRNIRHMKPKTHGARSNRDMRIESIR